MFTYSGKMFRNRAQTKRSGLPKCVREQNVCESVARSHSNRLNCCWLVVFVAVAVAVCVCAVIMVGPNRTANSWLTNDADVRMKIEVGILLSGKVETRLEFRSKVARIHTCIHSMG